MKRLSNDLREEYLRVCKLVGEHDPYVGSGTVGIGDVLRAHFLIADYFLRLGEGIGGVGPKSPDLLHSALARQSTSFGGKSKWTTDYEVCATLFYGLIMNHPFYDSNKRTAFLVALYHLQKVGRTPRVRQKDFEDLTVAVASHDLERYPRYAKRKDFSESDQAVLFIADFFKRNTRELDKRYYRVTYAELNNILKQQGCMLDNPKGNYIDIMAPRTKRRFFGLAGPRETFMQKVGQIGFPGWTTQVNQGAIKTVRHVTGLTPENGVDSEAFFHGAEPLQVLIETYHGPLQRLADK